MNWEDLQSISLLIAPLIALLSLLVTTRRQRAEVHEIIQAHGRTLDEVVRTTRAMEQRLALAEHERVENPQDAPELWTLGDDGEIIALEEKNENASTTIT